MSYKPKHCNQCGDKIERADWGLTTSRRFCDLCKTDYGHLDWYPRIAFCAAVVLAIVLIGILFRKPEKNLEISSIQAAPNNLAKDNNNSISPTDASNLKNLNSAIVQSVNKNAAAAQPQSRAAAFGSVAKPDEKNNASRNQPNGSAPEEAVYFCGAQTKKGMPCTRRVKGGGRCWQHAGQAAMLSPEKLIAN